MQMRLNTRHTKTAEWVALAAILLIAAYLRMGQAGVVEYKRDEANLSRLALDVATANEFHILGIGSSVGFPNAPSNVYVLAIPYLFDHSPIIATQFIGLLNVLAIGATYLLARRYFGVVPALITCLIFAISPWSLIFSRKIWAQNMLPLFVVMTVGSGLLGLVEGKRWARFWHVPLLVITGQVHYVAFVLIPISGYLWVVGRRYLLDRAFIGGVGLAVLLTLPYAVGLVNAGYDSPQAFLDAVRQVSGDSETMQDDDAVDTLLTLDALRNVGVLLAGTEIHSLAGPERFQEYLDSVPNAYPLFNGLAWLIASCALGVLVRLVRRKSKQPVILTVLLIWLLFPIVVFSFTWTPFFIHYLIPIFPAAYLVLAWGFQQLGKWLSSQPMLIRRGVLAVGITWLAAVLVLQLVLWFSLLGFVRENHTPDGFGTPLATLMQVRAAVLAVNDSDIIGRFDGQSPIFDGEPAVWDVLLYDVPSVRFEDQQTWVYPEDEAAFLTLDCDSETSNTVIPLREAEGCYAIGTRSTSQLEDTLVTVAEDLQNLTFANGVQVVSYGWQAEQCLRLGWRITQETTTDYHFAVNFLDETDVRVAQADALSWLGQHWRIGDFVVREFCIAQPNPTIARVALGMYTFDGSNFNNVDVINAVGMPVGQQVVIDFAE